MQDSSRTTSYIYDGDTSVKLSLWGGDYYWEFINDPTASIPAVLVSKGYVDLETTYVYYVREPGGELLASFDSAETPNTLYYHFDDLGSTVLTTDGTGGDVGKSTYRAWGWPMTSDVGPYLFCGRLGYYEHIQDQNWLEQSSLLQLGVRFYDRDIGRFTQRDPIGDTWNRYVSFGDSPVQQVDPSGLIVVGCNEHPRCNPKKERSDILKRIKAVDDFLHGVVGLAGTPLASSDCVCRDGMPVPITRCGAAYWRQSQCIQLCINEHEQTHRYQCVATGSHDYYALYRRNPWNLEKDAYEREIKCLRKLLGGQR